MVQERLSKDEAGEILYQKFHVVTMTQELQNSTRKFVRVTGYYLGPEGPLIRLMETWPCYIDLFEQQYDNEFDGNLLFGADLVDCIHKHMKEFLHSFNTASLDDINTGMLLEFREIQRWVKRGDWITSTPTWVELPEPKEDRHRN